MPTMARQMANSGVRFTSYNMLKQMSQVNLGLAPGEKLSTLTTFGIGASAGIITVYVTMPLDTIKTRMQSLEAKQQYGNSFRCAYKIMTEENLLAFWSGATPRLARLIFSGGIVFTVYEKMIELFENIDPAQKYF